jgi:hypothetical protein
MVIWHGKAIFTMVKLSIYPIQIYVVKMHNMF